MAGERTDHVSAASPEPGRDYAAVVVVAKRGVERHLGGLVLQHRLQIRIERFLIGGLQGAKINTRKENEGYGAVRAIDPRTRDRKGEFKRNDVIGAGSSPRGREGYFYALDARNGELLWKANGGGAVASGPMSHAVNGKQYFTISAGSSLFAYGLRE